MHFAKITDVEKCHIAGFGAATKDVMTQIDTVIYGTEIAPMCA